jgi:hypothetical protein
VSDPPTLFDEPEQPPDPPDWETVLRDMVRLHGAPTVRAAVARAEKDFASRIPSAGARRTDPATSKAQSHDQDDVRRFGAKSSQARLLRQFANIDLTDKEATDRVMAGTAASRSGHAVPISVWDGCRRRCSDLRRGGLIEPTGVERDNREVCRITPSGRAALARLVDTGWSYP